MPRSFLPFLLLACSSRTKPPETVAMATVQQRIADTVGTASSNELRAPAAFAGIADEDERSAALFVEMARVLTHPRCLNCHPSSDSPTQGDDLSVHAPPVTRGADGHGTAAVACTTCHGPDHAVFADGSGSVPGHPHWALAPASMAWAERTVPQICDQLRDPDRNGGFSLDALVKHNAEDGLVGYGWNPGPGREPAPGSQAAFGELTRAWVDSGAACPSDE